MMKRLLLCATVLGLTASPSVAEPVVLKFATGTFPGVSQNTEIFEPWIKKMNAAGQGVVKIVNTNNTLANVATIYDALLKGVLDMAWILHGFVPGQFPKSSVVQLPFEVTTGEEASVALWSLFKRGIIADEYKDLHVLALHGFPQFALHSKKPIHTLEGFQGVKTRISSKVSADIVRALGAQPVSLPSTKAYQLLSRGTVNADAVAWTAVCIFKINEATDYHLNAPLGGQGAMFVVNKATWAKLPPAAKKILTEHSSAKFSRHNGVMEDKIGKDCRDKTAKMKNAHFAKLDGAESERWKKAATRASQIWLNETPNGQAILDAYREEVAKYRASQK